MYNAENILMYNTKIAKINIYGILIIALVLGIMDGVLFPQPFLSRVVNFDALLSAALN